MSHYSELQTSIRKASPLHQLAASSLPLHTPTMQQGHAGKEYHCKSTPGPCQTTNYQCLLPLSTQPGIQNSPIQEQHLAFGLDPPHKGHMRPSQFPGCHPLPPTHQLPVPALTAIHLTGAFPQHRASWQGTHITLNMPFCAYQQDFY